MWQKTLITEWLLGREGSRMDVGRVASTGARLKVQHQSVSKKDTGTCFGDYSFVTSTADCMTIQTNFLQLAQLAA